MPASTTIAARHTRTDGFTALRLQVRGRVATPTDPDWDQLRAARCRVGTARPVPPTARSCCGPASSSTPRPRVARVGAGVKIREVQAVLVGTGLSLLAGSNGDPSVVGYTLGGSLGWF
jgi:hypothetical protein